MKCNFNNVLEKCFINYGNRWFLKERSNCLLSSEEQRLFEKIEMLKSTEISQHKLTLDPMVTPKVKKTSHYTVTVVDGVITKIELEEQYERNK